MARPARLRVPDLFRLQRLLRHGHRPGPALRHRAAPELQQPVQGGVAERLLAALAHDAVIMAARLPLHHARRQPLLARAAASERDGHDGARRPLARGQLDVRGVGRLARGAFGRAPIDARVGPDVAVLAAQRHLRADHAGLGVLPRARLRACGGVARGARWPARRGDGVDGGDDGAPRPRGRLPRDRARLPQQPGAAARAARRGAPGRAGRGHRGLPAAHELRLQVSLLPVLTMRPFVLVVLLLLALVVMVNGLATWDRARHEARIARAAAAFQPGLALLGYRDTDERRFQKARLAVIPRPRIVAFGSSRVMAVSTPMVGAAPGEFYNAGLSGGSPEDFIVLWTTLRDRDKAPEAAIFAIDNWTFNRSHPQVRWLAWADEVARFVDTQDGSPAWGGSW